VTSTSLLVVLDVDSTLTGDEGIDLIAQAVSPEVAFEVADLTHKAMHGELDFEESLRLRVSALRGAPLSVVEAAVATVTLTEGAEKLVSTLRAHGHFVTAVSGGFLEMVDPLAERLGLNAHKANRLAHENGLLTGELLGPIVDAEAKAQALRDWAAEFNVPLSNTVAVGDGGNDVLMLKEAQLGIAFMGKPVARAAADISIDTPDLAQVLSLLGFFED
jgi:phosphoserine phosphatase